MRLISCERVVNINTFEPELVLTLAVGIENIFDNNTFLSPDEAAKIMGEQLTKLCNQALEKTQGQVDGIPANIKSVFD